MKPPSAKRQVALRADLNAARIIRAQAIRHFGAVAVAQSPTLYWTERCVAGVNGQIPFKSTAAKNAGEFLWVIQQVIQEDDLAK